MKVLHNIGIIIMIAIYALLNFFVAYTINSDLIYSSGLHIKYILLIIFVIGTILVFLIYGLSDKNVGAFIGKAGIYSFGFSIIAFLVILITNLIGKIIFRESGHEVYFGIIQIIAILVVFIYGRYNISRVKLTNYSIDIDKESDLDNLNLVLISDLHLGYFNDNKKLKRNIEKINSLNPDIVVISGDLFDENFAAVQNAEKTREIFNDIRSKYGTFVSFGNHDSGKTFKSMKKFVESTNMVLLEDKLVSFDKKFAVAGRRDLSPMGFSGEPRNSKWNESEEKELPIILLEHQPIFNEYTDNVDLILSGHTHRGQIFPFNLVTKMYFKNHYGYVKLDSGIQTIVTSGLGTWGPPIRIGSKNEIVRININFKKKVK